MIIDGSVMNGVLDANRAQNVENNNRVSEPVKQNELGKTGRSTDAGPAVVTSFSAAALESARAVTDSSQIVEQNRPAEQQNRQASFSANEQQARIDVMV
jgi:hypothetical protein